jgi:hypothetical protein
MPARSRIRSSHGPSFDKLTCSQDLFQDLSDFFIIAQWPPPWRHSHAHTSSFRRIEASSRSRITQAYARHTGGEVLTSIRSGSSQSVSMSSCVAGMLDCRSPAQSSPRGHQERLGPRPTPATDGLLRRTDASRAPLRAGTVRLVDQQAGPKLRNQLRASQQRCARIIAEPLNDPVDLVVDVQRTPTRRGVQ